MEASEPMIAGRLGHHALGQSNTPMTIVHVLVTIRIAAADLNTHLKIIQVSTS